MSGGLIAAIRKANAPRPPEESVGVRIAILIAVMTGAATLAAVQAISLGTTLAVLAVLPFAYWVSYVRRTKDNWHIKIGLSVGAILALLRFLGQIGEVATLDEIRFPLADLFLWVQVLHSFDLPARKDLHFSLGSSLTLMAVAGSISQDLYYLPFLLVYFVAVVAALALGHRSEVGERGSAWLKPASAADETPRASALREVGRGVAIAAIAASLLFLVLPQPSGVQTFALPFSLGSGAGIPAIGGGIFNPGTGSSGNATSRFGGGAYYGIDDRMDLRVRGSLSDDLVMRVRSSAPAMWKGMIFETYDGVAWNGSTSEPRTMGGDPPYPYPIDFRSLGPRTRISQTFYIEQEQPSVVFSGGQPDLVWFPAGVSVDEIGALRTDSTLSPGLVYSVVASRGTAKPRELRAQAREGIPENIQPFLQLPPSVPDRVKELARRITRNDTNDYDRVKSIESYLARNFRYDLKSPVPPQGRDAVDFFLFETDVGFCEQFASATAVMLRSLGIPARVVAGYAPGKRNSFTGYYEVRASDAHSWVEVWFPQLGWYEFDPTFDIPSADRSVTDIIPLARLMRWLAEKLGALVPAGVRGAIQPILYATLAGALAFGAWIGWRKLRPAPRPSAPAASPVGGGPVTRAFRRLESILDMKGSGRAPPETAAELLARSADLSRAETRAALEAFEKERYAARPPAPQEADAAVSELHRLAERQLNLPSTG